MRKAYHQLEPRKFTQKEISDAPFRDEVKGEKYEEGKVYQDKNYPLAYFTWHPFSAEDRKKPGNEGVKGEWRMGAIAAGE